MVQQCHLQHRSSGQFSLGHSVVVFINGSLRQVFERIKTVTSSDIVAEVGAVYHFKVDSINQFWILFLWF